MIPSPRLTVSTFHSTTPHQPEQKLYHHIDWSKWKFHLDEDEEDEEEEVRGDAGL